MVVRSGEIMPARAENDGTAWCQRVVGDTGTVVLEPKTLDVTVGNVRIVLDHRCVGTVHVDGVKMKYVRGLTLRAKVGECPTVTVEHVVMPEGGA